MITHKTTYRVIYGDTDKMGIAYHANYLRWFEIGRSEMFRSFGITYKTIEAKGVLLPVSEAYCKFLFPAQYDDVLVINTSVDNDFKGGIKFIYTIDDEDSQKVLAKGYTKHACVDHNGRLIRPPKFLTELIEPQ
ncbi:MAG: thioesterase family protein [Desulfobacterales bacterium]|nr:thioesterase family protein [Desulfobacterales bacterium]